MGNEGKSFNRINWISSNEVRSQVIGFDPITTEAEAKAAGIEKMELEQIWPLADYITVHTPLIPSTKGNSWIVRKLYQNLTLRSTDLICSATLAKCKKGVKIINVARGGIVNEADLLSSLEAGHCGGAAVDV